MEEGSIKDDCCRMKIFLVTDVESTVGLPSLSAWGLSVRGAGVGNGIMQQLDSINIIFVMHLFYLFNK